jgi:hypothetical protein
MEVHFTPEQEARLSQIAGRAGTDTERLVKDAGLRLLEQDSRFRAAAREGIAQAGREEFSGGGEMDASRRADSELPTSRAQNAREMGHPAKTSVPPLRFASVGMTELLRKGIAQADWEEFIEEEEMDARIERMLSSMQRNSIGKRARRAIIGSQRTRRVARLAQIPRRSKERLLGMTIKLEFSRKFG